MALHPDKLVGIANAIQSRPIRPARSPEQAAIGVASKPKLLTPVGKVNEDPGSLIANLAYAIREQHQERHLDRLARRTDAAVNNAAPISSSPNETKTAAPPINITVPTINPLTAASPPLQAKSRGMGRPDLAVLASKLATELSSA